jgi:hypothetical protein
MLCAWKNLKIIFRKFLFVPQQPKRNIIRHENPRPAWLAPQELEGLQKFFFKVWL